MNTATSRLPPLSQLGPFIVLALACAVFGATTDNFFSGANFEIGRAHV